MFAAAFYFSLFIFLGSIRLVELLCPMDENMWRSGQERVPLSPT